MPTTALGSTRFVKQGVWSVSTAYSKDDVVYYNGEWYLCTADATAGTLPTNTSFYTVWQQSFYWRGQHVNTLGTAYAVGDVVKYTASYTTGITNAGTFERTATQVYRCTTAHTADGTNTYLPINITYWTLVSSSSYNDGTVSLVTGKITETWGVTGGSPDKCVKFFNQGLVGETNAAYLRGINKSCSGSYDNTGFITQNGAWRSWGTNNTQVMGNNLTYGPHSATTSFFFNDWFRSTSNGGAGVHSTPDNKIPRVVQVEGGWDFKLVLFNNGEVYHLGYGGNGESGDRSNSTRYVARVGGTYTETAVALNTSTHLFRDVRIKRIATSGDTRGSSAHHCLALDEDGQVWAWGYNAYGQLGDNSVTSRNVPTLIAKAFFGLVGSEKVVAIWAGGGEYGYNFALTEKNTLFAWGYNNYGHLGLGTTSTNVRVPTEVTTQTWTTAAAGTITKIVTCDGYSTTPYSSTAILTSKGSIYVAGYNAAGQFMLNNTSQQNSFIIVTSGPGSSETAYDVWLANGTYASMWVTDIANKKLWACGSNNGGQLGIAGTNATYSTAQECVKSINNTQTALTGVTKLSAMGCGTGGTNTTVIVATSDGWSYGAGYNGYGQLSLGTTNTYHYQHSDNNGKESTGQRGFHMIKMPPSLAGKVADVTICGYCDNSSTGYTQCTWISETGQVFQAGYNGATWNMTGSTNGENYNIMRPVITS
jgi:alpha-tubulin suppressor-like RCC1 family protein